MPSNRLAIVGAGPSCTYVLDRLAATARAAAAPISLGIHIFDRSGQFGAGQVHSIDQPVTSFLNRIVGQVAFAADESVVGAGPLLPKEERPTLLEWCRTRYEETGDTAFDLVAEDWPKRYIHGLALREQFFRYVRMLREVPGMEVHLHHAEVTDLEELSDGRLRVLGEDGEQVLDADHVLMLTGHSSNAPVRYPRQAAWARFAERHPAGFVPSAYPLENAFEPDRAGPGSTVGCVGMGLTGIDVILHLTEGRGGVFEEQGDGTLTYRASGEEPDSIVMFSRAGLFTFARPYNAKERNPEELEHKGVFLTEDAVGRLRRTVGRSTTIGGLEQWQLNFRDHIFPVVVLEMAHLYYTTLFGADFGGHLERAARPEYDAFLADGGGGAESDLSVRRLLAPLEALVEEGVEMVDSVLSGDFALSAAKESDWDVEAALRRFLNVVFGTEKADGIVGSLEDPAGLAAAVAGAESPWRHPKKAADNRFSWERSIWPIPRDSFSTGEEYRRALLDFIDVDHRWAAQDNLTNPAKAAADGVWRDLRGVLAAAVDFGGLHASSHRDFLDVFMRHHNRLCNGAALEVMEKIRALIECGLVDVSAGPKSDIAMDEENGRFVVCGPLTGAVLPIDVLVDSRVHPFDAENDVLPIYPNLLQRGIVRKWRNPGLHEPDFEPGGLDLTEDFHPVRAEGTVDKRLTLLGPPSEGVMFFQLGALRPNQNHHVMQDILRWMREFWEQVDKSSELDDMLTTAEV
ncbi:FAD/NAD(P)-binding protein [Haloactinomyces albus]|uniref:NAD(P)/FAD-binding protein YdhS n=1 Tax=Haloactinomyces albus TaxID=1352928 RepID=A0AAE4CMR5_9ACTN|nr:FAD/NAD(P)-binding protein [Haloactinomyces albus]MDR7301227.1 putative NAD(P)/FAD-binding protein YdhS [Haloactinomyces albus]